MQIAPIVEWYNVDRITPSNTNKVMVAQPYDFGIIDAGYIPTPADYYSFLIWNNRNRMEDAPQMEEVTIGVKDSKGGNGDTAGNEVWAINDTVKWFYAKVDSLGEKDGDFKPIGATITKPIGTNGTTTNPYSKNAVTWSTGKAINVGDVIKPVSSNGFVYRATTSGTTGASEPVWIASVGVEVTDNDVKYEAIRILNTPTAKNIILGGANSSDPTKNSQWNTESAGNFVQVTLKIEAPPTARSGRQDLKLRVSYRYI